MWYPRLYFDMINMPLGSAVSEALSYLSSSVAAGTPEVGAALVRVAFITQGTLAHTGIGREEQLKGRPVWVLNNRQILEAGQ